MIELILSFFASIGIILLIMDICDSIFYRKYKPNTSLTVDLVNCDEQEVICILELIAGVQRKKSGKAAIGDIKIILEHDTKKEEFVYHYLKVFNITAKIFYDKC